MSGRCSGCGRINSVRKISSHIVECPKYQDLYERDRSRALDPAAEYIRYQAEDRNPEARAERRGARMSVRFAEINRQQTVSAARWARPPDLLD